MTKAPSLFYTDGRGFILAKYILREFDIEMPFHPMECEVLNLLNIYPAQLSVNAWLILKSFDIKCHKHAVVGPLLVCFSSSFTLGGQTIASFL